jgi:general stress protein 26
MDVVLPADLVEFVESGVSVLVGTRDAQLRPHAMRAFGATVHPDRKGITIYLCESVSARTLADMRDNGQVAVTFSRPIDHRSIQLKGRVTAIAPTTEAERLIQERYLSGWVEQVYVVGLPRAIGRRMQLFPSCAVKIALHGLFHQTPGPDAGRRMDERT